VQAGDEFGVVFDGSRLPVERVIRREKLRDQLDTLILKDLDPVFPDVFFVLFLGGRHG
jgi:hypothetical protein